jgi:hypothetical protein
MFRLWRRRQHHGATDAPVIVVVPICGVAAAQCSACVFLLSVAMLTCLTSQRCLTMFLWSFIVPTKLSSMSCITLKRFTYALSVTLHLHTLYP